MRCFTLDWNRIPRDYLFAQSAKGRDRTLRLVYGFDQEEMDSLRESNSLLTRVKGAARMLVEAEGKTQATYLNIAAVICPHDGKLTTTEQNARNAIHEAHGGGRAGRDTKTGLQLFLETIDDGSATRRLGNLEAAVEQWPKIGRSQYDDSRDVTIPCAMDEQALALTAILKGDGLVYPGAEQGRTNRIELFAPYADRAFYRMLVLPLIQQLFNLSPEMKRTYQNLHTMMFSRKKISRIQTEQRRVDLSDEKGNTITLLYDEGMPLKLRSNDEEYLLLPASQAPRGLVRESQLRISFASRACADWLRHYSKIAIAGSPRTFVSIAESEEGKLTELAMLLSTGGAISVRSGGSIRYILQDRSAPFLEGIAAHATRLDFSPRLHEQTHAIELSGKDVQRAYHLGLFLNPRHVSTLSQAGIDPYS